MDQKIEAFLVELEKRSSSEQDELNKLRAKGVDHVLAAASKFMLDVGRDVGQFLNMLVRFSGAKTIVEIGGSVGYSTIWMAEAALTTGGKIISLEADASKHQQQKQNLEKLGLLSAVELHCGDAAEILQKLPVPFDLVLIDHWKHLYVREFDSVWPKMRKGGMVVADNILLPEVVAKEMRAYVEHVRAAPGARSVTLSLGNGLELTTKS